MNLKDLKGLKIDNRVIFNSNHYNPNRRSLNGIIFTIHDYNGDYPQGWKTVKDIGYSHDVAVCLMNTENNRVTFAEIEEFDLIEENLNP